MTCKEQRARLEAAVRECAQLASEGAAQRVWESGKMDDDIAEDVVHIIRQRVRRLCEITYPIDLLNVVAGRCEICGQLQIAHPTS